MERSSRVAKSNAGAVAVQVDEDNAGSFEGGLGDDAKGIVRHTLRHTAAIWLMQAAADKWEASGYLGMTLRRSRKPTAISIPIIKQISVQHSPLAAQEEEVTIHCRNRCREFSCSKAGKEKSPQKRAFRLVGVE